VDEKERDEKTEDATPQRLERMREDGQVALGREISAATAVAAAVLALVLFGGPLGQMLVNIVRESALGLGSSSEVSTRTFLNLAAWPIFAALGVLLAAAVGGGAILMAQTQLLFNLDLVAFKPERLFQLSRFTRTFSREAAADILYALVKTVTVASALALILKDAYVSFISASRGPSEHLLLSFFSPISKGAPIVILALLAAGGLDVLVQRYRFLEKAKMTKDEVRREMKESEGDPTHKSRRRRRHRDLAKGRAKEEVPRSDVIVVNPTHIAVALRYRRGKDRAPRVLCKGRGLMAERIREIARENGIPIYRDVPLARLLHKRVKVGSEVPAETFKAVAAVLAFAYRLKRKA
jgi:flagellar biosynthesis protein FlhB